MPKGVGIRCGNGFISKWKECHDGKQSSHPDFVKKGHGEAEALKEQILANLSRYTPEQQDAWEKYIGESFKKHGESRLKTQEEVYLRKLKGWEQLTREGPPKILYDQNGESVGGSNHLIPSVTGSTGAPAWGAAERGGILYKFQPGKKGEEGQWRQSTVSMYNDIASGRVQKAIDLYEKMKAEAQRTGQPIRYPLTQFDRKLTADDYKEIDRLVEEVKKQKMVGSVAGNGTNRNHSVKIGDPDAFGRTLVSAVQNEGLRNDKEYAEARLREIVTAYVRQNKVSALTGEPVSIPSIRDANGYPSVVDHNTPLSTAWKGDPRSFRDPEEAKKALATFDVAGNFSITERGLNTAKSDKTDWEEIIPIWKRRIAEQERNEIKARSVVNLALGSGNSKTSVNRPPSFKPVPSQTPKKTNDQSAMYSRLNERARAILGKGGTLKDVKEMFTPSQYQTWLQLAAMS